MNREPSPITPLGALGGLDLSQLRILDLMLIEHSVKNTAERLYLTSSAVSHALAKLREALGDELFIRTPDGMQPTARALEIAPKLRSSLRMLELALVAPAFEPSSYLRAFALACLPFVSDTLMVDVTRKLLIDAPNVKLKQQRISGGLVDDLENNNIDLAVGAFGRIPDSLRCQHLFREPMVFVLSEQTAGGMKELRIEDIARIPFVDAQTDEAGRNLVAGYHVRGGLERQINLDLRHTLDTTLSVAGLARKVAAIVPDTSAALAVVSGTSTIALLVRSMAQRFADTYKLRLFVPPFEAPSLTISMVWHDRNEEEPGHRWLRNIIEAMGAVHETGYHPSK